MKFQVSYFLLSLLIGGVNGQTPAPSDTGTPAPVDTPATISPDFTLPPVMNDTFVTSDPATAPVSTFPTEVPGAGSATDAPTAMMTTATPITGPPAPTAAPVASAPTAANYFDEPLQKWTAQIDGTGSTFGSQISKGNAVTVSPDGASIYVTLNDGRLEVLSANDGSRRWGYEPTPLDGGWTVSCKSGVSFGEKADGKYAVYAIIDVPPAQSGMESQSRVIAVSHPGNKVMWTSGSVPGQIEGTPLITKSARSPGEYIFFTHNQNVTTIAPVGSFSLVSGENGELLFTEVAGDSPNDPSTDSLILSLPYGPLGVAYEPDFGRYPGGEANDNDLFVWSTSDGEGKGPNGYSRAFQLPVLFIPDFAATLATSFLKENRWNAVAAPVLSADGYYLIFGVRLNRIRGWTSNQDFDALANMAIDLEADPVEPRTPVPYAPIFSTDETRFFVSASAGTFYAIDTSTGDTLWSVSGVSPASASPLVSPEDDFVYLTREDGTVAALRQTDGSELWSINCMDITDEAGTACADALDAASSISPNGLVFYYGDVLGNVKAVTLGESTSPTAAPTDFPTTAPTDPPIPTTPPTAAPTAATTPSPTTFGPTASPSSAPTASPSASPGPTGFNTTFAPTASPTTSSSAPPSAGDTPAPVTAAPMEAPTPAPVNGMTPAPVDDSPTAAPDNSSAVRSAVGFIAAGLSTLLFFV